MKEMIVSLLPVFMLLLIGMIIKKFNIIEESVIHGLKTIIIKIALPAVLFMAFSQSKMGIETFMISGLIFTYCVVLYLVGGLLHNLFPKFFPDHYTNAYFTGFEFGMIGIGLFTAIWGIDKLPLIAVIAFGHEVFIWFVYVPVLEVRKNGRVSIRETATNFIKTPTIIGILLGIMVNVLGLYSKIESVLLGEALIRTLNMLGNIIAPLILFVIGYSMTFKSIPIKRSIILLASRWIVVLSLGTLLITGIKILVPSTTDFFIKAFYAFILLPPPYILPLFMKEDRTEEISFFSEALIYYTVLSFVAYIVLMSF